MKLPEAISITHASENNLDSVSLTFPRNKLILVTGVSGSGKSSLVFDVIYREAESRYLGSFSSYARMFMGKMHKPRVERIDGLSPAIALDQHAMTANPRSTVGTLTGIYDLLRLLYARVGVVDPEQPPFPVNRSLFSFNTAEGACSACKGLGVEDFLDPELLVSDENRTLREGALVITAPNGYIIYSQVTLDVLDQVCRAEGFHIDIPWKDLTPEQKHIILYGSDKIEIPYGKHPLESRMRWSGITAKPREIGYYKGIIPVMENILQRDRNKNILRFVRTRECSVCRGRRINEKARSVKVGGLSIDMLADLQLDRLQERLGSMTFPPSVEAIVSPVIAQVNRQVEMLKHLDLGHLSAGRGADTLSAGEAQRLRLATLATMGLSGMIFIFDEPSVGMHPSALPRLFGLLKTIRDRGNTVIVVEHDLQFIERCDWLIDIGPGPGINGGTVLYNGPVGDIGRAPLETIRKSRTLSIYQGLEKTELSFPRSPGPGEIRLEGARAHNLRNLSVAFRLKALNVVTGVSGAGKSTLTHAVLEQAMRSLLEGRSPNDPCFDTISGWEPVKKLIVVDQSPIGRTPRSNPATYTGVFDLIRDLFAQQPEARARGFDKSRFSFNTEGGRCETCQGAGYQQVGMHFMGNVEVPCETCEGRRFDEGTLSVRYRGKNISEILDLTVSEALHFFFGESRIIRYLETLNEIGLGYLTLGQRSSTVSGGEAQRIKLASELVKSQSAHTLYLLDEPTTGLHPADIAVLLRAINRLIEQGNTVVAIEHNLTFILAADQVIDLGPGSGAEGGRLVVAGTPAMVMDCPSSLTGRALRDGIQPFRQSVSTGRPDRKSLPPDGNSLMDEKSETAIISPHLKVLTPETTEISQFVTLRGVTTHNLKNISVDIPRNRITVITGVSGCGKSSLAFDTIHAEAQNRFMEGFSPYIRSRIGIREKPDFEFIGGLAPTLALEQSTGTGNPRSTIGTVTGIYDLYRLLFSRTGKWDGEDGNGGRQYKLLSRPASSLFSFNHQQGACRQCDGLGEVTRCDPGKLITHPDRSILSGAMDGTKTGKFYGDPYGQYVATIRAIGRHHGIDFSLPWNEIPDSAKDLVMNGTGDELYEVTWEYKRDQRTGAHHFSGKWIGLSALVEAEYQRKHADSRGEGMMNVLTVMPCHSCRGTRLNPEALAWSVDGKDIARLSDLPVDEALRFFSNPEAGQQNLADQKVTVSLTFEIQKRLQTLYDFGLSYLPASRRFSSLSFGEQRRVRLAAQPGSGLTGIIYVLDEPTAGLHPVDTGRLMKQLKALRDAGNTLVIVEHDREVILSADHVIDLGPGAGSHGGKVVAEGTPAELMQNPGSLTGRYLRERTGDSPESSNRPAVEDSGSDREFDQSQSPNRSDYRINDDSGRTGTEFLTSGTNAVFLPDGDPMTPALTIRGAMIHNLKGFDVQFPVAACTVITGVSGSGKSSLVFDLIHASWLNGKPTGCRSIEGFKKFGKVIGVGQPAEFISPVSTVATYSGTFDAIRDLFSQQPAAREAGLTRNHFSFLNKSGQCPVCEGSGALRTRLDFLPEVVTVCEQCKGNRYREEILAVQYRGKNIGDVLNMTVNEASEFFSDSKKIVEGLLMLSGTGLEYLTLGQSLNTLSGGEARRLHLTVELMKPVKGPSLYLFDEPSTGLHFEDVNRLWTVFRNLLQKGHTLLVIENDPEFLTRADYIVELGPEGGDRGGYLSSAFWHSRLKSREENRPK